jgi:hypothetical protein
MREQVGPLDIWALHLPSERTLTGRSIHIADVGMLNFIECEKPRIGSIIVSNQENAPAFLQEGLIIEGLRQSRMVAFDYIIQPKSTEMINVFCVEEGRWSDEFDGDLIHRAPISVIAALREQPSDLRAEPFKFTQRSVWRSVARHQSRTQSLETTSLSHMVRSYQDSASYFPFVSPSSYEPKSGQTGLVVSALGQPLLMEMFGNENLFAQHFQSIIQSVLWDLDEFTCTLSSNKDVLDFLRNISTMTVENSQEAFYQVIGSLSLKVTHDISEGKQLHSLVINHDHPIFA